MNITIQNKTAILLALFLLTGAVAQASVSIDVKAEIPSSSSWLGQTAMAHWDLIDISHDNAVIGIDVVYGQQTTDSLGRTDMIYIKVVHREGVSEATGYKVNITSGPTWSMNHVYINATLAFNWTTGGLMNHPIAIDWLTSAPSTYNTYTRSNGGTANANGLWKSGTGNLANATITIGGSGPHPGNFTSNWAAVGIASTQPVTALSASTFGGVTLFTGQTWAFSAQSTGGIGSVTYQWYEGTTLLIRQTDILRTTNKATAGTYIYTCKVTDSSGTTATSNPVTLTVLNR